jgi:hypothetical protein
VEVTSLSRTFFFFLHATPPPLQLCSQHSIVS